MGGEVVGGEVVGGDVVGGEVVGGEVVGGKVVLVVCGIVLLVVCGSVVVVSLVALPFESAAELVVVESVLTFLPLSLVSVLVVVLESVVDCSAFWANMAVAVKSATKMNFFIRSLTGSRNNSDPGSTACRDHPGDFVTYLRPGCEVCGSGQRYSVRA